jgi:hypothetical protein
MNPLTDEVLEGIRTKTSPPRRTDWSREEEAETKLYREDGRIGLPSLNLFASLAEAGRLLKAGKRQISTANSTILPSFLTIEGFFLPFKGDPTWVADMRRGTNEKSQAVPIVRPRFDSWEFDVTIEIDETEVNEDTVRQLVEIAGKKIGLCDFRPNKKGPFGRFKVAAWVKLDGSSNGKTKVGKRELASATA